VATSEPELRNDTNIADIKNFEAKDSVLDFEDEDVGKQAQQMREMRSCRLIVGAGFYWRRTNERPFDLVHLHQNLLA